MITKNIFVWYAMIIFAHLTASGSLTPYTLKILQNETGDNDRKQMLTILAGSFADRDKKLINLQQSTVGFNRDSIQEINNFAMKAHQTIKKIQRNDQVGGIIDALGQNDLSSEAFISAIGKLDIQKKMLQDVKKQSLDSETSLNALHDLLDIVRNNTSCAQSIIEEIDNQIRMLADRFQNGSKRKAQEIAVPALVPEPNSRDQKKKQKQNTIAAKDPQEETAAQYLVAMPNSNAPQKKQRKSTVAVEDPRVEILQSFCEKQNEASLCNGTFATKLKELIKKHSMDKNFLLNTPVFDQPSIVHFAAQNSLAGLLEFFIKKHNIDIQAKRKGDDSAPYDLIPKDSSSPNCALSRINRLLRSSKK